MTYGNSHATIAPSPERNNGRGQKPIADHPSKIAWEHENVIQVVLKVNRNQDPALFELLQQAESKSGTVRELLRQAIKKDK